MSGRPTRIDWRPEDTVEALRARYRAERDGEVSSRLQALWLLRSGRSIAETAWMIGFSRNSVSKWVMWYRSGGLPEVLGHKGRWGTARPLSPEQKRLRWYRRGDFPETTEPREARIGRPRLLSPEQERRLSDEVATGRFRTSVEIHGWIEREFGVTYAPLSIYKLLERLGCELRRPRTRQEKEDAARWNA